MARTEVRAAIALAALVAVGGCGSAKKAQAKADARAAGFVPPSVMSRLDYGGVVERRFRALDRNGDDYITPDELPTKDSKLMDLDRNRDGKISASEWSEGMLARFDRMDRNHDGSVTSTERDIDHH
ncbi:hypothetical protein [Sphingomonas bacterium]|uniref:hypothetical protein n=1 Tax=Sphingomonas bacterium TaxID=1895847 RepID=UPI001576FE60|nr:hypothetical protein [Sphingomonas bacterium]